MKCRNDGNDGQEAGYKDYPVLNFFVRSVSDTHLLIGVMPFFIICIKEPVKQKQPPEGGYLRDGSSNSFLNFGQKKSPSCGRGVGS